MAQHDYNLANQSGADFRADLNNALSAIATTNSGATSPSTTFAHQLWVDTANNLLKIRNSANDAWITTGVSITADNTFTGNITGNASTATALETARTINGTSFDGTANISFDTDSVSEGSSNLYYTTARFDSAFSGKSTSDLSEGTNLYYTDTRFDTRLATKDTDDLTEGTNLYFTNARVESYLDAGTSTPTFASAVINSSLTGSAVLDDDTFATASATTVATSESIKAYVDSQVGSVDTLAEILLNGNTTGGTDIAFGDNDKAIFGTGSDLLIYHDGSNSFITDGGAGSLLISGGANVKIQSPSDEDMIIATANGAVTLYYNDAPKLATTSTGIDVTGTVTSDGLTVDGNGTVATFNGSTATNIDITEGDTTDVNTRLRQTAGQLLIQTTNDAQTTGTSRFLINHSTGDISFYDDTGASANLTWDASADSLNFVDGARVNFGASNDLRIFHDGNHSYIEDGGTGNLRVRATNLNLANLVGNNYINCVSGGAVTLYHNNSAKLATTSSGIDVTGNITIPTGNKVSFDTDGLTYITEDQDERLRVWVHNTEFIRMTNTTTDELRLLPYGGNLFAGGNLDVTGTVTSDGLVFDQSYANPTNSTATIYNQSFVGPTLSGLKNQFRTGVTPVERMRIESNGDISFYDDTGTTQGLFWDASAESLGIGTTSPSSLLNVHSSTAPKITISNGGGTSPNPELEFFRQSGVAARITYGVANKDFIFKNDFAGTIQFTQGSSEAARIDSSGHFLVATTNASNTVAGFRAYSGGNIAATIAGQCAELNRLSSAGSILGFQKDGTTVGSIGTGGTDLWIGSPAGTGSVGIKFNSKTIIPTTDAGADQDNAIDIGNSSVRFKDIYATNGTIQTSDINEKQDIEDLSEAETRVAVAAKGLLKKYRWKSAVADKGDDARIHFGIMAQDLENAFANEGLDAGDYGMFISSTWTDEATGEEKTRLGVRYNELLAFIIAAI